MQIGDLKNYLKKEKKVIIAFSGGADSVCLTHFLWKAKKYEIVLAHFNHHLRGEESQRDEKFCKAFSKKLELPIEIGAWENPKKSEAEARTARYAFLRKIQKKHQAQAICMAHHQDDQVETILFNFLRGTGIRGLSGMAIFENELLRPLLQITKKEILEYCKVHKLKFCTDKTNFDETFARNLLRLKILPELHKINPNLSRTILQNAQNYREIGECLEMLARPFYAQNKIKLKEFRALPQAVQSEILRQKMQGQTEPSAKKIAEILRIIRGGKGNKFKKFGKLKVSVGQGEIVFEHLIN